MLTYFDSGESLEKHDASVVTPASHKNTRGGKHVQENIYHPSPIDPRLKRVSPKHMYHPNAPSPMPACNPLGKSRQIVQRSFQTPTQYMPALKPKLLDSTNAYS